MRAEQINVEYWYRLLYDCLRGACYGASAAQVVGFLALLWLWIVAIGYLLSVAALFVIIYATVRLFELRKREEALYATVLPSAPASDTHPRWQHIQSLIDSASASEWREAILEADIMLDDVLARKGYLGEGVGERLKTLSSSDLASLQDAWEAHKIRNQIAHEGSAFGLSEALARRTIARYEAVFRELGVI